MKLGEFKDLARGGIEGTPLVSKRRVKGRVFEAGSLEVDGLPMEDDDDLYRRVDLDKRDVGGMEASRAKIDEWPSMPDELEDLEKTVADDELAKLFRPRTDDGKGKRKAMVVRPDIPRLDVRTLPRTAMHISDKMDKSRAKLAADTGEVDE